MSRLDFYDGGRLVRVPEPGRTLAAFEDILSGVPEDHEHEFHDGACSCGETETYDEYMERLRDIDDDARFEARRDERWR